MEEQAVLVPPVKYRRGPRENTEDDIYVRKSVDLVQSILDLLRDEGVGAGDPQGALAGASILDIGCGPLRLITGMRALGMGYGSYAGVDVDEEVIAWAREQVADDRHAFCCLDMENARYNPAGEKVSDVTLPFPDHSFHLVVLRSVFTHMEMRDIETYLTEISRKLHPDGHIYLSVYVSDQDELQSGEVRELNANPDKGPLHMQLVSKQWFEQKLAENGLRVCSFHPGIMRQPTYLVGRERG